MSLTLIGICTAFEVGLWQQTTSWAEPQLNCLTTLTLALLYWFRFRQTEVRSHVLGTIAVHSSDALQILTASLEPAQTGKRNLPGGGRRASDPGGLRGGGDAGYHHRLRQAQPFILRRVWLRPPHDGSRVGIGLNMLHSHTWIALYSI